MDPSGEQRGWPPGLQVGGRAGSKPWGQPWAWRLSPPAASVPPEDPGPHGRTPSAAPAGARKAREHGAAWVLLPQRAGLCVLGRRGSRGSHCPAASRRVTGPVVAVSRAAAEAEL